MLQERVLAFNGRDTWQGTFLDNHDQIRTLVHLQKLGITDETERDRRMDLPSVLLMTILGIPIIYCGDEQYLAYYNDMQTTPPEYVNSGDCGPYNRPGLNRWREETPAFKIIGALANLREDSPAVSRGAYRTIYTSNDILVFKRLEKAEVVLVAVNRGDSQTVTLPGKLGLRPGFYKGLIENASEVNAGNYLSVVPGSWTLHLNKLSSLVLHQ